MSAKTVANAQVSKVVYFNNIILLTYCPFEQTVSGAQQKYVSILSFIVKSPLFDVIAYIEFKS